MYVHYPCGQLLNLCHTLTEAMSSPPNTPQNLRIPVKLRPEPRHQPYKWHLSLFNFFVSLVLVRAFFSPPHSSLNFVLILVISVRVVLSFDSSMQNPRHLPEISGLRLALYKQPHLVWFRVMALNDVKSGALHCTIMLVNTTNLVW